VVHVDSVGDFTHPNRPPGEFEAQSGIGQGWDEKHEGNEVGAVLVEVVFEMKPIRYQNDSEQGLKRETRLMEKENGQWKIAGMQTTIYGFRNEN